MESKLQHEVFGCLRTGLGGYGSLLLLDKQRFLERRVSMFCLYFVVS